MHTGVITYQRYQQDGEETEMEINQLAVATIRASERRKWVLAGLTVNLPPEVLQREGERERSHRS